MKIFLQHILPHRLISKIAYFFANNETIWLKNYLIQSFLARYDVNLDEAEEANPFTYTSFNKFFTRKLKADARPVAEHSQHVVSPADGAIAHITDITDSSTDKIYAKGQGFDLTELLGGYKEEAQVFQQGPCNVIYLAPSDYHRVHMPFGGQLVKMIYVPGKLFSVNTEVSKKIPNLYSKNERVIAIFQTDIGKMAVILVGAMIVGSIDMAWFGCVNQEHQCVPPQIWDYTDKGIYCEKGSELGCFKLGSTVITLFEEKALAWQPGCTVGQRVRVGETMGISQAE